MLQSRASQNPATPGSPTTPACPTAPGNPTGPRGPSMPFLGSAWLPDKPAEDEIKGSDASMRCFTGGSQVKRLTSEALWSIKSWQALTWITREAVGSFLTYR